jgi:hypothetical protein
MPDAICAVCGKIVDRFQVNEGEKLFHLDCYVTYKRRPPKPPAPRPRLPDSN